MKHGTPPSQIRSTANAIAADVVKRAKEALYRRANLIMTRSKREFVPVDLSPLKTSGWVDHPTKKGDRIQVKLSYGNAAVAYALAVHEHPSGHDPFTWKGKTIIFKPAGHGPKYLERPMMEAVPTMAGEIAAEIKVRQV